MSNYPNDKYENSNKRRATPIRPSGDLDPDRATRLPTPSPHTDDLTARLRYRQQIRLAPDDPYRPVQQQVDRAVAEAWLTQYLEQKRLQEQWQAEQRQRQPRYLDLTLRDLARQRGVDLDE